MHSLRVYQCRKAELLVYNVRAFRSVFEAEPVSDRLLDIIYSQDTVWIYTVSPNLDQYIEVRVTGLRAELVVADQVVDVVAVHELPGGGQILSYGAEAMREEFAEVGIEPPRLDLN